MFPTERMADAFIPVARGPGECACGLSRPFASRTRVPTHYVADRHVLLSGSWTGIQKPRPALSRLGLPRAARIGARLEVTLPPNLHARRLVQAGVASEMAGIFNLGPLPRETALERLSAADALIFPSTAESLGIPMLEAIALGKPIIAAELGYVREVCVPVQTFDPHDARSIADAVARFLGCAARPVVPLGPDAFVAAILA